MDARPLPTIPLPARLGDRRLFPDLAVPVYVNHAAISPHSLAVRAAVQAVTACHLRPGGAVFFSHRAMHWGSRGRPDCARARISVSFGCSDASFERPYFKKPAAHLPFPKPSLRAALVSAQLINYHER